ncbi:transcriptional regulator [Lachnoclostridium sp. An131]|uniref:MBOAT family O-acyltransferase n=1 Tax=Lachnoclostridium sp. An131 TaxID=1965555 RepID=UPI000B3A91FF|nr:MBOAT family O-acyltransferase [Lachnoclostridium sp. An131]OUQ25340.1 transcriptional regulator [Lachnoclostridium sp. An131]
MVFSSIVFIFTFLPIVILAYYVAPVRIRNFILLLASLVFYAWGEPVYLFLMLYSILFNYVMGLDIYRRRGKRKKARESLILGVAVNLALLGFFKYYGFLAENLEQILPVNLPEVSVGLPIGLSFYTFQSISYLADVYRGKAEGQRNLISFGLYISMFPQLVAGPIVQYADIDAQLKKRSTSWERFGEGTRYFIGGLAKKVLLANNLGAAFEAVTGLSSLSVLSAWVGVLAYTFQIYFDFSGYSDMAVGLGKMFGFDFKENFHYPYCARSVTEFWRRWHISLGAWFREYVYIPLGGNRVGVLRHIRNLLIVWTLTGLWHGASWNFVVWGFYYGVLLIVEKYLFRRVTERLPVIGTACTMLLVMIGWVFFFSPSLAAAAEYLRVMFGFTGIPLTDDAGMYYLLTNLILFWISWLCSVRLPFAVCDGLWNKDRRKPALLLFYLALFLLCAAYLIHDTYNPFLYFRF